MILQDRAKVSRYGKHVDRTTGSYKTILQAVIPSLDCYIEPDEGVIIMAQQEQAPIYTVHMFCEIGTDIRESDIVENLSTGVKYKVIDVDEYRLLPHLEVKMQGGVVK